MSALSSSTSSTQFATAGSSNFPPGASTNPISDHNSAVGRWNGLRECPMSLDVMKRMVILTPCGHVYEFNEVLKLYGPIIPPSLDKNDIPLDIPRVTKPGPCPLCRGHVFTYIESPVLRDLADEGDKLIAQNGVLATEVEGHRRQLALLTAKSANRVVTVTLQVVEEPMIDLDYPGLPGKFICNRPWTALDILELKKYPGMVRWMSFQNRTPGAFIVYVRLCGMDDGSLRMMFTSENKEEFEFHLECLGLEADSKKANPNDPNGKRVSSTGKKEMGSHTTATLEQLKWAFSFIKANAFPQDETNFMLELMQSPTDWRPVEANNQAFFLAGEQKYLTLRKIKLQETEQQQAARRQKEMEAMSKESDEKVACER